MPTQVESDSATEFERRYPVVPTYGTEVDVLIISKGDLLSSETCVVIKHGLTMTNFFRVGDKGLDVRDFGCGASVQVGDTSHGAGKAKGNKGQLFL